MNHTNRSSAKRLRLRHAVPSLMPAPGPVQRRAELPVAEGTLKQIDCMGGKIRMRIGVGAKVLSFALPDPGSIAIKDHAAMDFTCGPQRPRRIRIEYEAKEGTMPATVGWFVRSSSRSNDPSDRPGGLSH